jgi:hypothetical protein
LHDSAVQFHMFRHSVRKQLVKTSVTMKSKVYEFGKAEYYNFKALHAQEE